VDVCILCVFFLDMIDVRHVMPRLVFCCARCSVACEGSAPAPVVAIRNRRRRRAAKRSHRRYRDSVRGLSAAHAVAIVLIGGAQPACSTIVPSFLLLLLLD
jgi:hypothetical protein